MGNMLFVSRHLDNNMIKYKEVVHASKMIHVDPKVINTCKICSTMRFTNDLVQILRDD